MGCKLHADLNHLKVMTHTKVWWPPCGGLGCKQHWIPTRLRMGLYQINAFTFLPFTLPGKRSFECRSSPGGSNIFSCPENFVQFGGRTTGSLTTLGSCPGSQYSHWFPLWSDLPAQGQASDINEIYSLLYTLALHLGTICSFVSMLPNQIFLHTM